MVKLIWKGDDQWGAKTKKVVLKNEFNAEYALFKINNTNLD